MTLGTRLKAERERRGLSLNTVAEATKIPPALLVALERDDLSRWPEGIYRRAFFRSYVSAIGLSPEPLLSEFLRLFDESEPAETTGEPLAMSFAASHQAPGRSVATAALEVGAVVGVGCLAAWALDFAYLTGSGALALIYYPLVRATAGPRWRMPAALRPPALGTWMSTERSAAIHLAARRARLGLAASARRAGRASAAALHAANHAFWRGIRAAAEQAQLLATRQLDRTPE